MSLSDAGSRYPVNFESWPSEQQVEHMELTSTRAGLILEALALAGHVPDREIGSRTRLQKSELAHIVMALEREKPANGP